MMTKGLFVSAGAPTTVSGKSNVPAQGWLQGWEQGGKYVHNTTHRHAQRILQHHYGSFHAERLDVLGIISRCYERTGHLLGEGLGYDYSRELLRTYYSCYSWLDAYESR